MKPSATRWYTSGFFFFNIYNIKESLDKSSRKNACMVVFNISIKIFSNKNYPY